MKHPLTKKQRIYLEQIMLEKDSHLYKTYMYNISKILKFGKYNDYQRAIINRCSSKTKMKLGTNEIKDKTLHYGK